MFGTLYGSSVLFETWSMTKIIFTMLPFSEKVDFVALIKNKETPNANPQFKTYYVV